VWYDERDEQDKHQADDDRVTASLAALAFTLLLVVVGLFLMHQLGKAAALQDCVLLGRTHCAPIDVQGEAE
jgi:hypothetical protein